MNPFNDQLLERESLRSIPPLCGDELAILAEHFNLGRIESTRLLERGSAAQPKAVLQTATGEFLLKRRRSASAEAEARIQEVQRIYQQLLAVGFPLPARVVSPLTQRAVLQRGGVSYELTQFIHGVPFDRSSGSAYTAGAMLGRFHQVTAGIKPPAAGTALARPFHGQFATVTQLATAAGQCLQRNDSTADSTGVRALLDGLCADYARAAAQVEARGFARWPRNIVHGDWHPGNLLFQPGNKIAAVLDLDSMRYEPRSADVANGCLQFSMAASGIDPANWPAAPVEERLLAFCTGYDEFAPAIVLSTPEVEVLPALMIEALIAESLAPIAATGSFLKIPGLPFLQMIKRKVGWLEKYTARICELLNT